MVEKVSKRCTLFCSCFSDI